MKVERFSVSVTTAADGSATAFSPTITGAISSIAYVADGTSPYAATVDFTITVESTGQGLWTQSDISASGTRAPRQPTHEQDGTDRFFQGSGTEHSVPDLICLANDRIKIVLAQGGDTKTGRFIITVI
ncbi:MAG: hypothetical protein ACK5ZS_01590 [bacterium]